MSPKPAHQPGDKVWIDFHMDHGEIGVIKEAKLVTADGDEFYIYLLEGDMGDPTHGPGFLESELQVVAP